jgi:tetratricopeptide (TPR) repeat protein
LDVEGLVDAQGLLDELAREVDLVERRGEALYHRTDVRRIMLELIERELPDLVEQIEEAAARYYGSREGIEARAEEIYHRLRLGRSLREIETLWEPGVEHYLDDAIDELPRRARAFLEARLGGRRIGDDVLEAADLVSWEIATANIAESYIDAGEPKAALDAIRQRKDRSGRSPVYAWEARALAARDRREQALKVVDRGLDRLDASSQAERMELHGIAGALRGGAEGAKHFQAAARIARRLGRREVELRMSVARVEALAAEGAEGVNAARDELCAQVLEPATAGLTIDSALALRVMGQLDTGDGTAIARLLPYAIPRGLSAWATERAVAWVLSLAASPSGRRLVNRALYNLGFDAKGDTVEETTIQEVAREGKLHELLQKIVASGAVVEAAATLVGILTEPGPEA